MTYQQVLETADALEGISEVDLEVRRHFVGLWATDASILAGHDLPELYDIGETTSKEADHYVLTWDRVTFGGGQYGNLAASFSLGRKDSSVVFPTDDGWTYETCTEQARRATILLYSSNDRRGWLLDGATALVHLARASLTAEWVGERHQEVLSRLRYIQTHEDGLSAKRALLLNAYVEIFTTSETRNETTAGARALILDMTSAAANTDSSLGLTQEPQSRTEYKRVEMPWTYRDLVLKLWRKLERLQAEPQRPRSLHISVRSPGARLTGWETEHLISHNRRVAQRYVRMGSESQPWLRYVKKVSPVVLLAPNFGNLVSVLPDALVCKVMRQVPIDRGLLVAPIYVLSLNAKRWQDGNNSLPPGCVQIDKSTYLCAYDPFTASLGCGSIATCAPISTLQNKPGRHQASSEHEEFNILARYPNGVVVFGAAESHDHVKEIVMPLGIPKTRMRTADVGSARESSAR
jgi:hypothetical protein